LTNIVRKYYNVRFQVFIVVKILVVNFSVIAPGSLVGGYQGSRGRYCLHLQSRSKPPKQKQYVPPEHYPPTDYTAV
jgi:hypothetical protein